MTFPHPRAKPPGAEGLHGLGTRRDLYNVLKILPGASDSEARAAYRQALLFSHPDKGGTPEEFHNVTAAFRVLGCASSRYFYDNPQAAPLLQQASAAGGGVGRPKSKRGKSFRTPAPAPRRSRIRRSRRNRAMGNLFEVLQAMDKAYRLASITKMRPAVRVALADYMEGGGGGGGGGRPAAVQAGGPQAQGAARSQKSGACCCTRLRAVQTRTGTKYTAHLDIGILRAYTLQEELGVAQQRRLALRLIQGRMAAALEADADLWEEPQRVASIVQGALLERGASFEDLTLRFFVQTRASEWVACRHAITSPVLSLEEAILCRNRLWHARQTSWQLLRAEWIRLLQLGKRPLSAARAEAFVDKARRDFLELRLTRAVSGVERTLPPQLVGGKRCLVSDEVIDGDGRRGLLARKQPRRLPTTQGPVVEARVGLTDTQGSPPRVPYLSESVLRAHEAACSASGATGGHDLFLRCMQAA